MKTYTMFLAALLITGSTFAQQAPLKRPNTDQRKGIPKVDFTAEPTVAPSAELDVNEFLLKRKDYQGQVIELTFDRVTSLKQAPEGYIAEVTYEKPMSTDGLKLLIPAEALDLFEKLSTYKNRNEKSVYIEVISPFVVKVLGTRYSKSKPEGERYRW